jgi:hypothetical protein
LIATETPPTGNFIGLLQYPVGNTVADSTEMLYDFLYDCPIGVHEILLAIGIGYPVGNPVLLERKYHRNYRNVLQIS